MISLECEATYHSLLSYNIKPHKQGICFLSSCLLVVVVIHCVYLCVHACVYMYATYPITHFLLFNHPFCLKEICKMTKCFLYLTTEIPFSTFFIPFCSSVLNRMWFSFYLKSIVISYECLLLVNSFTFYCLKISFYFSLYFWKIFFCWIKNLSSYFSFNSFFFFYYPFLFFFGESNPITCILEHLIFLYPSGHRFFRDPFFIIIIIFFKNPFSPYFILGIFYCCEVH